jgi:nuclear pore complex protein Nup98-Nup96
MEPSLCELEKMSDSDLRSVVNFRVSLKGVGSISFMEPVDLLHCAANREVIKDICGKVVIIEPKCVTVYPDEKSKPAVGCGLNVKSCVSLYECWPPGGKTAASDPNSPEFLAHLSRVKTVKGTEFLGFNVITGCWRFKVEHFRYIVNITV